MSSDEIRFFMRLQNTPIRIVVPSLFMDPESLLMDPALRHSREVASARSRRLAQKVQTTHVCHPLWVARARALVINFRLAELR